MSGQTPSDNESVRLRELAQRVLSAGRSAASAPWVVLHADAGPLIVSHLAESHELRICNPVAAFNGDDDRPASELVANFELIALYRSAAPALAAALLRLVPEPPSQASQIKEDRGLESKYHVARVDGRPLKGGCIVLEFGDERAAPALRLWADSMAREGLFQLAAEVRARISSREPVR